MIWLNHAGSNRKDWNSSHNVSSWAAGDRSATLQA